jgi:hypothetical protein
MKVAFSVIKKIYSYSSAAIVRRFLHPRYRSVFISVSIQRKLDVRVHSKDKNLLELLRERKDC